MKLRSTPNKKDGYKVRVIEIRQQDNNISLLVFGGRGYPENGGGKLRFFEALPERIEKKVTVTKLKGTKLDED